jgi:hypothetical protein
VILNLKAAAGAMIAGYCISVFAEDKQISRKIRRNWISVNLRLERYYRTKVI